EEKPAVELQVCLTKVPETDRNLLLDELKHFGELGECSGDEAEYRIVLRTNTPADDIEAVLCFIIEADQISISPIAAAKPDPAHQTVANVADDKPARVSANKGSAAKKDSAASESTSIRVTVDKVDAIINLVGELVI